MGVEGNQRGVCSVVPEAYAVGVMFRTVAGDHLLLQK